MSRALSFLDPNKPVGRHMTLVHPDLQVGREWSLPSGMLAGVTDDYAEVMLGLDSDYPGCETIMGREIDPSQLELRRREALARFVELVPWDYQWTLRPELWDLQPVDLSDRRLGFCPGGKGYWVALDHTRQLAVLFTVF